MKMSLMKGCVYPMLGGMFMGQALAQALLHRHWQSSVGCLCVGILVELLWYINYRQCYKG